MADATPNQEENVNISTMGEYAIFKGFLESRVWHYNQIMQDTDPHKVGKLTFYRKYIQGLLHKIRDFETRHELPLTKFIHFSSEPIGVPEFEVDA